MSEKPILDKIMAMMAKAESAKEIGSLAEAETFATKAQELLVKHNLSAETIDTRRASKDNPFHRRETDACRTSDSQAGSDWRKKLAITIAYYNLCKMTLTSGSRFALYGRPENTAVAAYLFEMLARSLRKMAIEYYNKRKAEGARNKRTVLLRSYLAGAVCGITKKLEEQSDAFPSEMQGLVVAERNSVDTWMNQTYRFRPVGKVKSKRLNDSALTAGFKDAQSMHLTRGLTSSTPNQSRQLL